MKLVEKPQDYECLVGKQDVDFAPVRCQMEELGNIVPRIVDPNTLSDTLEKPPITDTGNMIAHSHHRQSERYERSAQIASKVREERGNQDRDVRMIARDRRDSRSKNPTHCRHPRKRKLQTPPIMLVGPVPSLPSQAHKRTFSSSKIML